MESIAERLSLMENLCFPRALQSYAGDPSRRKSNLLDLLSHDVVVFLERYGSLLTSDELREFETLDGDYEINWHLKHLRSKNNPTSEELRSRSVTVKTHRHAYLDKLICDGRYFSEDAREREPYLHHEYVGKFQDPSGRSMARPGEQWSETLMRRSEQAILVAKIREEQQRLGVAQRDRVGNKVNQQEEEGEEEEEEEEEDDDDEEEEDGQKEKQEQEAERLNGVIHSTEVSKDDSSEKTGPCSSMLKQNEEAMPSEEEMQDRMDQFTYIMHQKFLSGEDHQHLDYSTIDDDETLDDHWLREANYDAEEKYFAED